jgi:hypothetical protein
LSETVRDFNGTLNKAIGETIRSVLGPDVLETLYHVLDEKYSVTGDELAYRLETLWEVLENGLGHVSSRTVGRSIAKLFYSRLGLQFVANDEWRLQDYVEEAKKKLAGLR